jgi:hypothetical protein
MFKFLFGFFCVVGGYWYGVEQGVLPSNPYVLLAAFFVALLIGLFVAKAFGRTDNNPNNIVKWG